MPARMVRDVKARLTDKFGFASDVATKHAFYVRQVPGVGQISTHFSLGRREIKSTVIAAMAGQLRVTLNFFNGMLDCDHDCDAWIQQIQENPVGLMARFKRTKRP